MVQEKDELCCLVNPIGNCAVCGRPLCVMCGAGHFGAYHRPCWWEVWTTAMREASEIAKRDLIPQKQAFAKVMGYSEAEAKYL